jgi:hypothetical protein
MAHWRSVLYTKESQFQLYGADGRQRRVGERFADVNVVNRMPIVAVGLWYWQA